MRTWKASSVSESLQALGWNPDLHPRGHDGKFIDVGGLVKLLGGRLNGRRARVKEIQRDKDSPGRPRIILSLLDENGGEGRSILARPNMVEAAPDKARLDEPSKSKYKRFDFNAPPRPAPDRVTHISRADRQEQARQKLITSVNESAAELSTTDPEERARGLDKILARLRFSIIDTDRVHDHLPPPQSESGRWTPERNAQHEQMWQEVLSQVEAAGVPQDHDALVLGGLPGAGKSFMLRPGQKADKFGVVSWEPNGPVPEGATHVSVNPDIVKEMMIQHGMLPEGISPDLKPMEQVTFLHEESSFIAKMFSQRLGDLGYNVVLDNTMDSEGGMLKRMTPLARQGYKFRGIFADIPQEESLASAKKRYMDSALTPQGGRFVPSSVQGNRASSRGNMSKNRDAMDALVEDDWFTEWMIVDNTGVSQRNPRGEVVGEGTGGGTAADRYLPGHDANLPKAGPRTVVESQPAPTIVI